MKKHFILPLSLLVITFFGLISCSNFLSVKTNVEMTFNGQELYKAVKARQADSFDFDTADLEIKLFVNDKEFSKQTEVITKKSKNISVEFPDIKLESVVYAEAAITIKNPDKNEPVTIAYGKSDSKVLTDLGVELQIELKWVNDNTPVIPDDDKDKDKDKEIETPVNPNDKQEQNDENQGTVTQEESFTLKYIIYKYDQNTDVNKADNYELYKSYNFTVNYKDFKNFSDFTCIDLIVKTTEMSFDMCLAGYEENYTLEDGDEPEIINGEATLNSYWYKTGTPITPTILVQKADIAKYQLKLYNGDDKIYIIEDDNGNRLAMGSWMINMTSIEPMKYGIYLGQALTYNDGIPKLSFDIGNSQPYTPELNDISTDGLTIKNLIGDTETTITFETSGLDVQALMSGTSPGPQVDSIVISIDCEDEMYAAEDTIKISAKYSKQNINVPLDKIYTEIYMGLIPTQPGVMPIQYEIYPNKDPNMPPQLAKDSYFNVTTNENTLILAPDFPDGFIDENNSDFTQLFYITVEADDGTITETDNKSITILSGTRPDAVISMSPDPSKGNIPQGSTVTITAVKKDGTNVSADYISVEKIEQCVTDKNGISSFNEIPATSYSVNNEDADTKAIILSGLSDGNSYRITIVVDDRNELHEEKQFNVSMTTPISLININGRTPSEMTSAITEVLTNVYNSRSKLHLKFSGENDATGYNLYSEVMEIANSKGFSPYSEIIYNEENEDNIYNSGIFTLDYSECGGAVVDSIPDETYQKAVILYSLKISPDTTKIGSKAFAGENSNVLGVILQDLDLKNVTEVGVFAFMWARIIGTLNMPKVTKLGDSAFDNFTGGTVNLDNLVKIDKLEEDGYGDNVFRYAAINTFYAPKLEVLRGATFYDSQIKQIPDSLVIVDNNSLHFRNIYNVAFESDAGKQGWYQITGTYLEYTSDELMTLLYEHPENWDAVLAKTGVLTPIDPSDVISSFQNQGREFIRRK